MEVRLRRGARAARYSQSPTGYQIPPSRHELQFRALMSQDGSWLRLRNVLHTF